MGELSFSIPNAVRLGDMAEYIAPDLYEAAEELIVDILSEYFAVQYAYYVPPNLVAGIWHICND